MLAINSWLIAAANQLSKSDIASARLDAELILAHTLRKGRTYLHAHGDELLDARHQEIADARLALRLDHVPIAYIIGHKEFYGRRFKVTTATLIPRPESEDIITLTKQLLLPTAYHLPSTKLVDVGTGSGCLGITMKLELPELNVTLIDISQQALNVARANAKLLQADVNFLRNNLLTDYPFKVDFIVANLPYVDPDWERSVETDYEPQEALFASNHGLGLIMQLIDQTPATLNGGGYLILEADPEQHAAIIAYAKQYHLRPVATMHYCVALQKS